MKNKKELPQTFLNLRGQCCAYSGSSRCPNNVAGCSNHCSFHREKAINLYNKYKILSDQISKIDIHNLGIPFANTQENIDFIMKYYVLLDKTYNARMKHRKYAFVPECYDEGHDFQFSRLQNELQECEEVLAKLYILQSTNKNLLENGETETKEGSEESNDMNNNFIRVSEMNSYDMMKKAKRCNKRRHQIEKEFDETVNKYIKENHETLERRKLLIIYISKFVDTLFKEDDPDGEVSLITKSMMLFNVSRSLSSIGYFLKEFEPERCLDKNCKCFISFDVVLICHCIFDRKTIEEYFGARSEETLKIFYETLLLNQKKIRPLVSDIMYLFYEYNYDVMDINIQLVWNPRPGFKRYTLEENFDDSVPQIKHSKLMAMKRLKDKFFEQKKFQMRVQRYLL